MVSIHAPARGATYDRSQPLARCIVSIHAPARGATAIRPMTSSRVLIVSIHAPARGATRYRTGRSAQQIVSIHAPARGATPGLTGIELSAPSFNPRPRAGGDAMPCTCNSPAQACFNPRPRAGGDGYAALLRGLGRQFQSTPPRGGRPAGRIRSRTTS